MVITGVYAIRHILSGKMYVGSTAKSFSRRFADHRRLLLRGESHNVYLQRAWNKYGEAAFEFVVLERCDSESCVTREQWWIDHFKAANRRFGYNGRPTAESNLGVKWSSEVKQRMASAARRRLSRPGERIRLAEIGKLASSTPEKRARLGDAFRGKHHTSEARSRISKALTGKKKSPEAIAKTAAAQRGRKISEAQRLQISTMNIGRKASAETRSKMSESHKRRCAKLKEEYLSGRRTRKSVSEETKARMSASQSAVWKNPRHRKSRVDGMIGRITTEEARRNMSRVRLGKNLSRHHVDAIRKSWTDEKKRANRVTALRASWADPEKRSKRLRKLRRTWSARVS